MSSASAAEIRSEGLNLVNPRMTGSRGCRAGSRILSLNLWSNFGCVGAVVARFYYLREADLNRSTTNILRRFPICAAVICISSHWGCHSAGNSSTKLIICGTSLSRPPSAEMVVIQIRTSKSVDLDVNTCPFMDV